MSWWAAAKCRGMPLTDTAPQHRWAVLVPLLALGIVALYFVMRLEIETLPRRFAFVPQEWNSAWQALQREPLRLLSDAPSLVRRLLVPALGASVLVAGPLHLATAVFFLWIFGDNVEARLGVVRFVILWLAAALVAAWVHVYLHRGGVHPVVGATGAIAGVLGAYLVLFRRAHVRVLGLVEAPCWLAFVAFFVLQLRPVQQALGWVGLLDGIDVRAHGASLVAGVVLTPLLLLGRRAPQPAKR